MNPFGFLEGPLEDLLLFLIEDLRFTIGWAIIMLTVIVRLILLPLFVTQYRSARRMQEISPLIKAVQAKHKNDRRKQQEETMRLFQEHRVNPFGSCLPIVFQVPVFISLYFVLRDFAEEHPEITERGFLFIPDIADQFRDIGFVPAAVLAIIYGTSQLLATEVGFATSPQTSEMQRKIFRFIPLVIVGGLFLYPDVPAGLVVYWMATNLWTCGQQVVLKRRLGPLQLKDASHIQAAPETEAPAAPAKRKGAAAEKAAPAETAAPAKDAGKRTKGAGASGGEAKGGAKPAPSTKPRSGSGGSSGNRRRPPKKR